MVEEDLPGRDSSPLSQEYLQTGYPKQHFPSLKPIRPGKTGGQIEKQSDFVPQCDLRQH